MEPRPSFDFSGEAEAAAEVIAPLAQEILEDPQGHLKKMLSRGHYRGTEVRLMAPGEPDNLKMAPYPAHLWRWRNTLSFAWQNEDNITTLEMLAALAEIRRRARQFGTQGTKFFHVPHHGKGDGKQQATQQVG